MDFHYDDEVRGPDVVYRLKHNVVSHLADADSAPRPPIEAFGPTRKYLPDDLRRELNTTTKTINKYAKLAGIKTPKRGGRNHQFTTDDRDAIYSKIIEASSDTDLVKRCRNVIHRRNGK